MIRGGARQRSLTSFAGGAFVREGAMLNADSTANGRARRRELGLLAAISVAVALVLHGEMFRVPFGTGFGDYQFFHHNWEFGRVAWSRFGELPLLNPYYCGGIPDFGDPQSQIHHPLFFLSFLIGTTLALKIFVLLHAAAGFFGMYLYARRIAAIGVGGSALAALAWTGSGFFAWH